MRVSGEDIETFRKWLEISGPERTALTYSRVVERILRDVGWELDEDRILMWFVNNFDRVSPSSYRVAFYGFKKFCVFKGVDMNWNRFPVPPPRWEGKKAVDQETLKKIFDACETVKEKAIVKLLYDLAFRVSELLELSVDDIRENENGRLEVRVSRLKRGTSVGWVELDEDTDAVLRKYLEWSGIKKGKLFPCTARTIELIVKKVGKRTGVDITPHVLRHSRVTHLIEQGWNLEMVRELVGHRRITTTQEYVRHFPASINELKRRTESPKMEV